tara:strand:- start:14391 stop:15101 length:711 start_codon:yes stop_codon:yes gene_type:complete
MGVNINSVYQKVLALLNKEQRGYLTPQEFNLLADRAQNEIYEAYFHKARNSNAKLKDDDQYTDTLEMIEAKLSPFIKIQTNTTVASGVLTLPTDIYKLINIKTNLGIATEVTKKEEDYIIGFTTQNNALYPNVDRPIYSRRSATTILITPTPADSTSCTVSYYKKPTPPNWTYVVLQEKALYNSSAADAQDFELLESEEEPLVSKILMLSGVITKQQDIGQVGANAIQMTNQEQNS